MPDHPSHLGLYRSGMTSPEHRRHITVGRSSHLQDTLEILRSTVDKKSKHHFLFIGPRGIGKTHLLSLIADEVREDKLLSSRYLVARFPEEANRVLSFADFLLRLCEILRDVAPDETEWSELYEKLQTEEDDSTIIDQLVPRIRRTNREKKRTLLITLENLNELFTRQIRNKKDLGALRKFFMDNNGCQLVATAPLHFDAITSVDQPFYDFFDVQILDHLSEEQTIDLIHLNLEWDKKTALLEDFATLRPKLRALYRMTGGLPRLTIMLYELIANDSITKVRQQFEILLDRISPFYQDRLNDLPPQERAVLETMASMRDQEKTPRTIAKKMRMTQPQTSTLLKRLSNAHYIRSSQHPNDKRSRLYRIREGFFDIWLGMNVSRATRARIPYLLDFFAMYYPSQEERDQKRGQFLESLNSDNSNGDPEVMLDYLSSIGSPTEQTRAKISIARNLHTQGRSEDAQSYLNELGSLPLDKMGQWIVTKTTSYSIDYLEEIQELIECWEEHRTGNLEAFASRLTQIADELDYKSFSEIKLSFIQEHIDEIPTGNEKTILRLHASRILTDQARWKEAEKQLKSAYKEITEDSEWHIIVLNNLAQLLQATNRLDEAEPLMQRSLKISERSFGKDNSIVAINLNNLAQLFSATNRLEEAEPLMQRALDIDERSFGKDHPTVATRLNNLATILQATNRLNEAEPLMQRTLDINERSFGKDHPTVARSLNNLAQLLQDTNRLEEAEPLMQRALDIDERSFGKDHPTVASNLNNLAQLLQAINRLEEAEPLMQRSLEIDEQSFGKNHPAVARDLNNLALLFKETNRPDKAEPLMQRALEIMRASLGEDHPNTITIRTNLKKLRE